jgi:hypothetical protein
MSSGMEVGLWIRLCETPDAAFEVELGLQDFKQFATQATGEQQQRASGGLRIDLRSQAKRRRG